MEDHLVDIVDGGDNILGKELKSLKVQKGFISRVVAIFICDSGGKLLMCKRGAHKAAGNLWDLAACGNVISGESYSKAAERELGEELAISCNLRLLDKFYAEISDKGKLFKFFCGVFLGFTDEKPKLNDELVDCKKMSFDEIETELANNPSLFCPGFVCDFNQVKSKLKAQLLHL